jgi:hypothetical protein
MLMITLVLVAMLAVATICAIRLTRPTAVQTRAAEVSPMKAALERRLREGGEISF